MKPFKQYLQETENRKTKTKTKTTDWDSVDDLFSPRADQPLTRPEPEDNGPGNAPAQDPRQQASRQTTRNAAASVNTTTGMRDMLNRMRDIEADPDDPGYPEPEQDTALTTQVNTQNLPAIAGARIQAAGVQNPEFHQVAALPGNMARAIRTLGRRLFSSFTSTPTDDIWMLGNLNGQGPNTRQEVNAVASWIRDNGEQKTSGDIDFEATMPGYRADIQQWSAAGIRWLLVRDEFGDYVYSWPENTSRDGGNTRAISNNNEPARNTPRIGR
jgi:hypothetical protein